MSDLLGSRIHTLVAAERALLISDLHLPVDGGPTVDALAAAIDRAASECRALFVLGDLFDSYVSRAQVRSGVVRDVATSFRAAVDAGTRITVLKGNRDFLLGSEFVHASGVELIDGGARVDLGGVDTLLLHGDELCQNDLPYQRAKRWLRHPLTRAFARRLPLAVAHRVAERARRRSQRVIQSGDQARFLPSERAVAAAFATGARRLVFGHIHRQAEGGFDGGRYHVLPAFDQRAVGLSIDSAGERWVGVAAESVEVLAPPTCPWSR